MTTPTSDLKARLDDLRASVESEIDIAKHNGWKDDVVKWNEHLNFLSDLSRLLTPSDSDTAKALEALAQVEEDAHDADLTESIRTCILSLSAQLAEKEGEVERLREGNEELQRGLQRLEKENKVLYIAIRDNGGKWDENEKLSNAKQNMD